MHRRWHWLAVFLGLSLFLASFAVVADLTVVWGEDRDDLATLDPRITQSRHELQVIRQVFDSLITMDDQGRPVPWLAESWEVAEDFTSITFHLKPGIMFHDGTPCNADAFKFTYDSIADPATGSQAAIDYLGPYKQTVVHDELSFTVEYTRPYGAMISGFVLAYLGPVSPTAIQANGDAWFAENPVGTGPFKFVEWVRRSHITLTKNAEYNWAPANALHNGPAYIDTLGFKFIKENSTRAAALETGEIHVGDLMDPLDVMSFEDNSDFDVFLGRVGGVPVSMYLNTSRFPTSELAVRRAIFYALDLPTIVDNVFFGYLNAATGVLASSTFCYWDGAEGYYEYNPATAEQILADAGWVDTNGDGIRDKNGTPLSIYCPIIFKQTLMVAVQAELKKVGIDLNVENVTKARQDELIMNNQYEAGLVRWVATDPSVLGILMHTTNIPAPGYFKFNWQHFSSSVVDGMLAKAESATSPSERCEIYATLQELVLDLGLIVPLQETTQTVVYASNLTGLRWEVGNYQALFYDVQAD